MQFWDGQLGRFINVPPQIDFTPLKWESVENIPQASKTEYLTYSRIAVAYTVSDYMMGELEPTLAGRIIANQRRNAEEVMAERLITDGIGLLDHYVPNLIVTPRMPEVALIHPKIYGELLQALNMNELNNNWFPPRRL